MIFIAVSVLFSCTDEEEIDYSLFDPAFPSRFIKLVDESGVNLIENGTINPDRLSVTGDFDNAGFWFKPERKFAVPEAEIRNWTIPLDLVFLADLNFNPL